MLALMTKMMPEMLAQWIRDGQPDDAVFQVAAKFPMEKLRTSVVREGSPLDVWEFVKQIGGPGARRHDTNIYAIYASR